MNRILLVGTELPVVEGLAQSLAAVGFSTTVAESLHEARELAVQRSPLLAVISRQLAADWTAEMLRVPLAPGGALVLYRAIGSLVVALPASVQRAVLADLTLPLERNRLIALAQSVQDRARITGRAATTETATDTRPDARC